MKINTEWKVSAVFVSIHWTALLLWLLLEEVNKKFLDWTISLLLEWICITGLMGAVLVISEYCLIPDNHERRIRDVALFLSASLAVLWFFGI